MIKTIKHLISFILIFNFVHLSSGQDSDKGLFVRIEVTDLEADLIQYSGYISEGTNRDTLYLLTRNDKMLRIPFENIASMESQAGKEIRESRMMNIPISSAGEPILERDENIGKFREKGIYAVFGAEFNFARDGFLQIHPALDLTVGYKINRMLALGIGGSVRSWTYDVWPSAVGHVYGEARGWLLSSSASPYYRLRLGYGNAFTPEQGNFRDSRGGLYASPSVGVRIMGNRFMQMNFEVGLNHQEITYLDLDFGAFERKYSFNRAFIGISMMY